MKNTIFINEEKVLYNLSNRSEYLKQACDVLNSAERKIVSVSGFQGTGKTEFVNALISAAEENILCFYYECSPVTHLDNIILSLFNFLKKMSINNPEYKRSFKISNSQSIDDRLINGIKNLNRPLIIAIDGFENIVDFVSEEEQKEVVRFIDFLSSFSEIKVLISGRKVGFNLFKGLENTFQITLGGLKEQEAFKILKNNGTEETESVFRQIFQASRGYPESLLLFSNAVKILNTSSFELMKQYYEQDKKGFEEFIYGKLLYSIPEEYSKIINFYTAIRHSIRIETPEKLNFTSDVTKKAEYLCSRMILTKNKGNFCIKSLLKNIIYSKISQEEKKQVHRYLYEIYSEQISKKLEERVFDVSRKLLYSEQYHHYTCLLNLGDRSADLKELTFSHLKPDFKYLYTNIADSLFIGSKAPSEHYSEPKQYVPEHVSASHVGNTTLFDKIELTEEEKALLKEEKEDDDIAVSEEVKPNSELQQKAENLKSEGLSLYEKRIFDKAIDKLEEALVLYEILKDPKNTVSLFISIANAHNESFKHDTALMYYRRVLGFENVGAEYRAAALCGIADILGYRNDFSDALKYYQKAFDEIEKTNDTKQKVNICFKMALAYDDIEDYDNALKFYLKNTDISKNIEINPYIAASFTNMAAIFEEKGLLDKAENYYQEALKFDKHTNNNDGQYETLSKIGNLHFEMNNYQNANNYFHEALAVARKSEDAYKISMSLLDIGDIYLQEKNCEKAVKAFIMAGKTIENTISTDSKEKIDRRFKKVINEIGEYHFRQIIEKLKKKHE